LHVQSPGLEQALVQFLFLGLVTQVILRYACRQGETAMLVDKFQLFDDVVVEAIEGDQERTNTWSLIDQSLIGEGVLVQTPASAVFIPDTVLLRFVVTIKGAQVKVRRTLHLGRVIVVCIEEI
jgi:hypothetical protein